MAFIAKSENKWFAVVDGKEEKQYDHILKPGIIFCPKGNKVAYIAQSNYKWFAVVDGRRKNSMMLFAF